MFTSNFNIDHLDRTHPLGPGLPEDEYDLMAPQRLYRRLLRQLSEMAKTVRTIEQARDILREIRNARYACDAANLQTSAENLALLACYERMIEPGMSEEKFEPPCSRPEGHAWGDPVDQVFFQVRTCKHCPTEKLIDAAFESLYGPEGSAQGQSLPFYKRAV